MKHLILAAALLVPLAAHAGRVHSVSPYASLNTPVYPCVPGDNSVAINGLLSNGGDVEIGPGKCGLAHGLMLTVPGTTLNGAGIGQTTLTSLKPGTFDTVTIGVAAGSYVGSGFTLSNMTLSQGLKVAAPVQATTGRNIVINAGVHADSRNSFGANVVNVESRFAVDGFADHGSDIAVTGLWTHANRHSGFFVMGLPNFGPVYGTAHNVTLKGSRAENNNLDNQVGKTWDNVDISRNTANVTIGGLNPGDGNSIIGGDILLGCPPWYPQCTAKTPSGPFLVQGNTVTNVDPTLSVGMRAYGTVTGAVMDHNTITVSPNGSMGANFMGGVTNSRFTNNVVNNATASGFTIAPISGYAGVGDSLVVDGNNITIVMPNKPALIVQKATNVTVTNNNGNGAPYSWSQAGSGFLQSNNH